MTHKSALVGLVLMACSTNESVDQTVPVVATAPQHLPFFDSPEFTPRWLEPTEVPTGFHQIPEHAMTDQHGAEVTEAAMTGKVTVVDFFFASCRGICPRLAQSMQTIDEAFPSDAPVLLLSYSVMPEHDTVDVLATYAQTRGVTSPRWHFLTGDRAQIYSLGRTAYFVEESMGIERDDDEFLHTENVVLIDQNRRIRGIYNGVTDASVRQLITDAQTLLAEADSSVR